MREIDQAGDGLANSLVDTNSGSRVPSSDVFSYVVAVILRVG